MSVLAIALVVSSISGVLSNTRVSAADASYAWDASGIESLSISAAHSCAVVSGKAYCWGNNSYNQMGNPGITSSAATNPVPVDTSGVLAGKYLKEVVVTGASSCAVDTVGMVYCWGSNMRDSMLLGAGSGVSGASPVAVDMSGLLAGKTAKKIVAGETSVCIIASDDRVYCWGNNQNRNLGVSTILQSSVPVAVDTSGVLAGKSIKDIDIGFSTACVIASDDKVYCWGGNMTGLQDILPTAIDMTGVLSGLTIKKLGVGTSTACAIASDDQAYCWGSNNWGELGNGSQQSHSNFPVAVDTTGPFGQQGVRSISVGSNHVCAQTEEGQPYCWGGNDKYQLGDGTTNSRSTPGRVSVIDDTAETVLGELRTMSSANCFVTVTARVMCWGSNEGGAFGNGKRNSIEVTPVYTETPRPSTLAVESVSFDDSDGRLRMVIGGKDLGEYMDAFSHSLVTLNGVALPFCSESFGMPAQDIISIYQTYYGVDLTGLVGDAPPCYLVTSPEGDPIHTSTQAIVLLPGDFNTTAQGTISVNGSPVYTFNPSNGGETPTTPTAGVDGSKPIDQHPVIKPLPTFSGVAKPGATVTVTVHSDPVICTTTADSNGNWSCTLNSVLPAGEHTVYVRVTNPDNSVENLGPYAVTVGETITNQTPTAPNTGVQSGWLYGMVASAALLMAFSFIGVLRFSKK